MSTTSGGGAQMDEEMLWLWLLTTPHLVLGALLSGWSWTPSLQPPTPPAQEPPPPRTASQGSPPLPPGAGPAPTPLSAPAQQSPQQPQQPQPPPPQSSSATLAKGTKRQVVVVMLDGSRWDYLELMTEREIGGFRYFKDGGVRVEYVESVFPSVTYPAWTTLGTGLHPESHDVLGNSMYDRDTQLEFNASSTQLPIWWQEAEPIWATVTLQGLRAATIEWNRADVPYHGVLPEVAKGYTNSKRDFADRVEEVIWRLRQGFDLVMMYYEKIDTMGHHFGPASEEVFRELRVVGRGFDRLFTFATRGDGRAGDVHVLVVADHGMAPACAMPPLNVSRFADVRADAEKVVCEGASAAIYAKPGRRRKLLEQLKDAPGYVTRLREDIPIEFHYREAHRAPDLLMFGLPVPWNASACSLRGGVHGFDPTRVPDMRSLFLAWGSAFAGPGLVHPPLRLVDIYQLYAHLLHVTPRPHNGTWEAVRGMLLPEFTVTDTSVGGVGGTPGVQSQQGSGGGMGPIQQISLNAEDGDVSFQTAEARDSKTFPVGTQSMPNLQDLQDSAEHVLPDEQDGGFVRALDQEQASDDGHVSQDVQRSKESEKERNRAFDREGESRYQFQKNVANLPNHKNPGSATRYFYEMRPIENEINKHSYPTRQNVRRLGTKLENGLGDSTVHGMEISNARRGRIRDPIPYENVYQNNPTTEAKAIQKMYIQNIKDEQDSWHPVHKYSTKYFPSELNLESKRYPIDDAKSNQKLDPPSEKHISEPRLSQSGLHETDNVQRNVGYNPDPDVLQKYLSDLPDNYSASTVDRTMQKEGTKVDISEVETTVQVRKMFDDDDTSDNDLPSRNRGEPSSFVSKGELNAKNPGNIKNTEKNSYKPLNLKNFHFPILPVITTDNYWEPTAEISDDTTNARGVRIVRQPNKDSATEKVLTITMQFNKLLDNKKSPSAGLTTMRHLPATSDFGYAFAARRYSNQRNLVTDSTVTGRNTNFQRRSQAISKLKGISEIVITLTPRYDSGIKLHSTEREEMEGSDALSRDGYGVSHRSHAVKVGKNEDYDNDYNIIVEKNTVKMKGFHDRDLIPETLLERFRDTKKTETLDLEDDTDEKELQPELKMMLNGNCTDNGEELDDFTGTSTEEIKTSTGVSSTCSSEYAETLYSDDSKIDISIGRGLYKKRSKSASTMSPIRRKRDLNQFTEASNSVNAKKDIPRTDNPSVKGDISSESNMYSKSERIRDIPSKRSANKISQKDESLENENKYFNVLKPAVINQHTTHKLIRVPEVIERRPVSHKISDVEGDIEKNIFKSSRRKRCAEKPYETFAASIIPSLAKSIEVDKTNNLKSLGGSFLTFGVDKYDKEVYEEDESDIPSSGFSQYSSSGTQNNPRSHPALVHPGNCIPFELRTKQSLKADKSMFKLNNDKLNQPVVYSINDRELTSLNGETKEIDYHLHATLMPSLESVSKNPQLMTSTRNPRYSVESYDGNQNNMPDNKLMKEALERRRLLITALPTIFGGEKIIDLKSRRDEFECDRPTKNPDKGVPETVSTYTESYPDDVGTLESRVAEIPSWGEVDKKSHNNLQIECGKHRGCTQDRINAMKLQRIQNSDGGSIKKGDSYLYPHQKEEFLQPHSLPWSKSNFDEDPNMENPRTKQAEEYPPQTQIEDDEEFHIMKYPVNKVVSKTFILEEPVHLRHAKAEQDVNLFHKDIPTVQNDYVSNIAYHPPVTKHHLPEIEDYVHNVQIIPYTPLPSCVGNVEDRRSKALMLKKSSVLNDKDAKDKIERYQKMIDFLPRNSFTEEGEDDTKNGGDEMTSTRHRTRTTQRLNLRERIQSRTSTNPEDFSSLRDYLTFATETTFVPSVNRPSSPIVNLEKRESEILALNKIESGERSLLPQRYAKTDDKINMEDLIQELQPRNISREDNGWDGSAALKKNGRSNSSTITDSDLTSDKSNCSEELDEKGGSSTPLPYSIRDYEDKDNVLNVLVRQLNITGNESESAKPPPEKCRWAFPKKQHKEQKKLEMCAKSENETQESTSNNQPSSEKNCTNVSKERVSKEVGKKNMKTRLLSRLHLLKTNDRPDIIPNLEKPFSVSSGRPNDVSSLIYYNNPTKMNVYNGKNNENGQRVSMEMLVKENILGSGVNPNYSKRGSSAEKNVGGNLYILQDLMSKISGTEKKDRELEITISPHDKKRDSDRDHNQRNQVNKVTERKGSRGPACSSNEMRKTRKKDKDVSQQDKYGRDKDLGKSESSCHDSNIRVSGARDSNSRESHNREYNGREYNSRDHNSRESHNRDSNTRDSNSHNSIGRDSNSRESNNRDSNNCESNSRDPESRDSHDLDNRDLDSRDLDTRDLDTHFSDFQDSNSRSSNCRESNSRDSSSKDLNNKDSSSRDGSNKDSNNRGSNNRDSNNRDSNNRDSSNRESTNRDSSHRDSTNREPNNNDPDDDSVSNRPRYQKAEKVREKGTNDIDENPNKPGHQLDEKIEKFCTMRQQKKKTKNKIVTSFLKKMHKENEVTEPHNTHRVKEDNIAEENREKVAEGDTEHLMHRSHKKFAGEHVPSAIGATLLPEYRAFSFVKNKYGGGYLDFERNSISKDNAYGEDYVTEPGRRLVSNSLHGHEVTENPKLKTKGSTFAITIGVPEDEIGNEDDQAQRSDKIFKSDQELLRSDQQLKSDQFKSDELLKSEQLLKSESIGKQYKPSAYHSSFRKYSHEVTTEGDNKISLIIRINDKEEDPTSKMIPSESFKDDLELESNTRASGILDKKTHNCENPFMRKSSCNSPRSNSRAKEEDASSRNLPIGCPSDTYFGSSSESALYSSNKEGMSSYGTSSSNEEVIPCLTHSSAVSRATGDASQLIQGDERMKRNSADLHNNPSYVESRMAILSNSLRNKLDSHYLEEQIVSVETKLNSVSTGDSSLRKGLYKDSHRTTAHSFIDNQRIPFDYRSPIPSSKSILTSGEMSRDVPQVTAPIESSGFEKHAIRDTVSLGTRVSTGVPEASFQRRDPSAPSAADAKRSSPPMTNDASPPPPAAAAAAAAARRVSSASQHVPEDVRPEMMPATRPPTSDQQAYLEARASFTRAWERHFAEARVERATRRSREALLAVTRGGGGARARGSRRVGPALYTPLHPAAVRQPASCM